MSRNFGIPHVTTGRASGVQPLGRSHYAHNTQRDPSNVISLTSRLPSLGRSSNSRDFGPELFLQDDQPVIEPYELGSCVLFLFVVLAPVAIVGGLVIGYLLFVS